MSGRLAILAAKAATFTVLSIITVATVYGYRLDGDGAIARTGIVDISVVPRDAEILLDGQRIETASGQAILPLSIGRHSLTVQYPGYHAVQLSVDVDSQRANRLGTIYLAPRPERLEWSGRSTAALPRTEQKPEAWCATAWASQVGPVPVLFDGQAVTVGGNLVSADAADVLGPGNGTLLIAAGHALLSLQGSDLSSVRTVRRFDNRLRRIIAGPSPDNAFAVTERDVSLCSVPAGSCSHVLNAGASIASVRYATDKRQLEVSTVDNRVVTASFPEWSTGFFGR